jgi:hypothetical protein
MQLVKKPFNDLQGNLCEFRLTLRFSLRNLTKRNGLLLAIPFCFEEVLQFQVEALFSLDLIPSSALGIAEFTDKTA